jgi:hypothetical protein
MPTTENGRTEKNPGFVGPGVRCVLTNAEIPSIFFAGLRKRSRDEDFALPVKSGVTLINTLTTA